jgi:putative transcriptional regulator
MDKMNFDIFNARKKPLEPANGRILIAEPFLQGAYFSRSIILITEYSKEGAVGFVLNKSSDMYPDEVIDDLYNFRGELYLGGPVASDTLHFIHTLGNTVPGAVHVSGNIYWGGDFEFVKKMINSGKADNRSVKFFAGYSGWSAGQLDEEIAERSWIVSDIDEQTIFSANLSNAWKRSLTQLGDVYATWSNFPVNPAYN